MAVLLRRFGRRIQELRKAAGLTQEELAARVGISAKYLGAVERAERDVTLGNVERLVASLDVEPYEPFLFRLKEAKHPAKVDEEIIANLIRHADKSVQPFLVELLGSVVRWVHSKKK